MTPVESRPQLYFNPAGSKCRAAAALLKERGVEAEVVRYLESAPTARLLDAVTEHPILLERPIIVRGERAVIARPPERLLELLTDSA